MQLQVLALEQPLWALQGLQEPVQRSRGQEPLLPQERQERAVAPLLRVPVPTVPVLREQRQQVLPEGPLLLVQPLGPQEPQEPPQGQVLRLRGHQALALQERSVRPSQVLQVLPASVLRSGPSS